MSLLLSVVKIIKFFHNILPSPVDFAIRFPHLPVASLAVDVGTAYIMTMM
jgi:hypothetical protein